LVGAYGNSTLKLELSIFLEARAGNQEMPSKANSLAEPFEGPAFSVQPREILI